MLRGRSDLPKAAPNLGEGRVETQSCLVGVASKTLPWEADGDNVVHFLSKSLPGWQPF